MNTSLQTVDLPFATKLGSGKVRELYELDGDLLLVTSDRISAFDVVMDEPIPGKGRVLTELSCMWFELLGEILPHHLITADVDAMEDVPHEYRDLLRGRVMRCHKAEPLPVEWIVRGYLTGSGWKDYQREGCVSGVSLPSGMQHASQIEPAILTPSTKAESGHDEPISFEVVVGMIGEEIAVAARDAALALYHRGRDYAAERGIVIADTKFEFGIFNGELMLIDECLTPDSSRFWPAEEVKPGGEPTSFDKQFLRNYLNGTDWNKEPPAPTLPEEIVAATAQTYEKIKERLIR